MNTSNDAQIEQDRVEHMAARDRSEGGQDWRARSSVGSFGCHEALHTASILAELVSDRLLDHGAVLQTPEWYRLAYKAHEALTNLYQAIGAAHLDEADR